MRIFKPKKINIERFIDLRGDLTVFSSRKNNFNIKRIYLIENKSTKLLEAIMLENWVQNIIIV